MNTTSKRHYAGRNCTHIIAAHVPISAATSSNRSGVLESDSLGRVWIPGEGFVSWHELKHSIDAASREFWWKRANRLAAATAALTQAALLRETEAKTSNCGLVSASNHKAPAVSRTRLPEEARQLRRETSKPTGFYSV